MTNLSERVDFCRRRKGTLIGAILVVASTVTGAAFSTSAVADNLDPEKIDLTYPKAGHSAPMINRGELNYGEPINAIEKNSEGHLIIDQKFRKRIARPPMSAVDLSDEDVMDATAPTAAEIGSPTNADEQVIPPAAEDKPLGAVNPQLRSTPGATNSGTGGQANTQGLLWKVSRSGEPDSWLFGTIHSEDPRVLELPGSIRVAMNASTVYVPEADLSADSLKGLDTDMLFTDGQTMESIIGTELFGAVATALKGRGVPQAAASRIKPWYAVVMLISPPQKSGMFLDRRLYGDAERGGKKIVALETLNEQLNIFRNMSNADQIELLRSAVENQGALESTTEQLTVAWLDRDLGELMRLSRVHEANASAAEIRLRTRLIEDRNTTMAQRLLPMLGKESHFVAVGAMHLPGNTGLIQSLRDSGYTLSAVY